MTMGPANSDIYALPVNGVYQRTGKKSAPMHTLLAAELIPDLKIKEDMAERRLYKEKFLMILSWPRELSYLAIRMKYGPNAASLNNEFSGDTDVLRQRYTGYGISPENIPQDIRTGKQHVLVAEVSPTDVVGFSYTVDTDHKDFVRDGNLGPGRESVIGQVIRRTGDSLIITLQLYGYALVQMDEEGATPNDVGRYQRSPAAQQPTRTSPRSARFKRLEAVRDIEISVSPAKKLEAFEGFVALDLGTTSSTLACLRGRAARPEDIEVVQVEGPHQGQEVPTAVRIQEYVQPTGIRSLPAAKWSIGESAIKDKDGFLVLGAKRLLADPRSDPLQVRLNGRRVTIPKLLAAELFISSMFKGLARKLLGVARKRQTAITHPITFSSREVGQLKQAVHDGWRRSWGAPDYTPSEEGDRGTRGGNAPASTPRFLMIDEASAAAIFFIYKDIIYAPGRMRKLRYLYPQGLNLLLYDCGGGTTDVALVRARATALETDGTEELVIEVMGRTGKRDFGGDNITSATFQIIKAKLAAVLSKGNLAFNPNKGEALAVLAKYWDKFERYVPTKFSPDLDGQEDEDRMKATLDLWTVAEEVKKKLSSSNTATVGEAVSKLGQRESALLQLVARANGMKTETANDVLSKVEVEQRLVNELIERDVRATIQVANEMLREKLNNVDPESEVHRVYVVGNASRYPLIREMLADELNVRFVEERLIFDKENLKNAVVKGAVLARRLDDIFGRLNIEFDSRLSDRLPYDIIYEDLTIGDRVLFKEHRQYSDLEPVHIDSSSKDGAGSQLLPLYRRWPGTKKEPDAYFSFEFAAPIAGPIEVNYDPKTRSFWMRSEQDNSVPPVKGVELIDVAVYRSPVQLGDIPPRRDHSA